MTIENHHKPEVISKLSDTARLFLGGMAYMSTEVGGTKEEIIQLSTLSPDDADHAYRELKWTGLIKEIENENGKRLAVKDKQTKIVILTEMGHPPTRDEIENPYF